MAGKMLHTKADVLRENISVEEGVLEAVVGSTNVLDRMGDVIDQGGWNLKNYKTNPVILWGHNVKEERPPIGKALKVWVQDKGTKLSKLMFKVKFDLQDSFAAEVYRKIKDGFINTVSVGFLPVEWEDLDPDNMWGGRKYTKQELLELSFVPVPANPEAIVALRSMGEKDKRFEPHELTELYPEVIEEMKSEEVEKPFPNEHACRLLEPSLFEDDSFRRMKRKHDGKEYSVIMGKKKGEDTMTDQAYRYAKDVWSSSEAKSHCKDHDGSFEAASSESVDIQDIQNDKASDIKAKVKALGSHISMMSDVHEDMETMMEEGKDMKQSITEMKDHAGDVSGLCDEMTEMMGKAEETLQTEKPDGTSVQTAEALPETTVTVVPTQVPIDKEAIKAELEKALGVLKTGRVLSSKNEDRIRQAQSLLDEVLGALDKQDDDVEPETETEAKQDQVSEEEQVEKSVVPYKDLGTLPETEGWDGPGEEAKANVEDLKLMSTWYDSEKSDAKNSYKLPHHKAEGHKAVWRGVAAAMASLLGARGGAEIPEADRKGVYNHLKKHYVQFDKEVPDFKMIEDQVLAGLGEELHALSLEREEKYEVRLIKKVLKNQKLGHSTEQVKKALEIINVALSLYKDDSMKGGEK